MNTFLGLGDDAIDMLESVMEIFLRRIISRLQIITVDFFFRKIFSLKRSWAKIRILIYEIFDTIVIHSVGGVNLVLTWPERLTSMYISVPKVIFLQAAEFSG